jgi:hypothetical protein
MHATPDTPSSCSSRSAGSYADRRGAESARAWAVGSRAEQNLPFAVPHQSLRPLLPSTSPGATSAANRTCHRPRSTPRTPENSSCSRRSPGQHTERRGSLLGRAGATTKRLYYIDWPLLDRHRETLAPRIDRWFDLRDSRNPASLDGSSLRRTAAELSTRPFRARPTFDALATEATVEAAPARYDTERGSRSRSVARAARQAGRMGQQLTHPLAVALRNTALRLAPSRATVHAILRPADWTPPDLG